MEYILNEKKYAEHILQEGYVTNKNLLYSVNVLAKYYKTLGYERREARKALKDWLAKNNTRLPDSAAAAWIKRALETAERQSLCDIDYIEITQPELDRIRAIHSSRFKDISVQKLAFSLLCLAKFGYHKGIKSYWVNAPYKYFFGIANLAIPIEKQNLFVNELYKDGYIDLNPKIENHNIKVLGIFEGETAVTVANLNEAGLVYEEICGKKFSKCTRCNKMIAITNGRNLYCKSCAKENNREKTRERIKKIRTEMQNV